MAEQKYFATVEHIESLLKSVKEAGLNVPKDFGQASIEDLQKCYNGVGPDSWSTRFRSFVTSALKLFEPEALIHDWEFTYSPKTFKAFTAANIRFMFNGIKFALFCTKTLNKKLVRQIKISIVLAILCQIFGWFGYKNP